MQFLLDNPRILFTLMLLVSSAALVLLMAMVYWVIAKVKAARPLLSIPAEQLNMAAPIARSFEDENICCPGGAQAGACSCR